MNLSFVITWGLISDLLDAHYERAVYTGRFADPLLFSANHLISAGLEKKRVLDFRKEQKAKCVKSLETMIDLCVDKSSIWDKIEFNHQSMSFSHRLREPLT